MRSRFLFPAALVVVSSALGWAAASVSPADTRPVPVSGEVVPSVNHPVFASSPDSCEASGGRSALLALSSAPAKAEVIPQAAAKRPNILVICGDDIGLWNISQNNRGMMGYHTPNIDRIAREGVSFTDYDGQQSCREGRAAFIGGNVPVRTGMTKVGLPGAKVGLRESSPATGRGREVNSGMSHVGFRCEVTQSTWENRP